MNKQVLILDDSEIVASLTAFLVENIGYDTIKFTSGEDALDYLENSENKYPKLIIADHFLTSGGGVRKTGYKVLSKLKSFGINIPVIMFSGNCKKSVIEKYMKLGVVSYICKDDDNFMVNLLEQVALVLKD